ncbi:MAG: methyltransferase domain-containing protein [Micropruina sp.]|nr:methyltransferase domain-containing protein [Micropruina sp.]
MLRTRLVDLVLNEPLVGSWRRGTCAAVSGRVLEIGFGSGANLAHYGPLVSEVLAVDPSDDGWLLAADRVAAFGRPVNRVGTTAELLALPDGSADAVVSTWTLCSIPDLGQALAEARRVLKPGGALHFAEHSLHPNPRVQRIARAIQPLWGRVSGGCHIDRDLPALLAEAGWTVPELHARQVLGGPATPFAWFLRGRALPS